MVDHEKCQNLLLMMTKITKKWRYEKLTGASAAEHHQKENERISKLYHRKKSLCGKGGTDSNNNDNEEEERAKELSHFR